MPSYLYYLQYQFLIQINKIKSVIFLCTISQWISWRFVLSTEHILRTTYVGSKGNYFLLNGWHVRIIVKILNIYIILSCTHLYHFFLVSIHYLQCIFILNKSTWTHGHAFKLVLGFLLFVMDTSCVQKFWRLNKQYDSQKLAESKPG